MRSGLFIFLTFLATISFSQIRFNTGSPDLDTDLNAINTNAKIDLGGFKVSLSADYKVTSKQIDHLFSLGMQPGEVYLSLEISAITGKKVEDVAACYKSNKTKGWGYIAKEMGIKPGSAEFHELKGHSKAKKEKGNSSNNKGQGNGNGKSKNKKK